jgi:hypothetical protein
MRFLKLDRCDEDEPIQSVVEAESLDALLDAEAESYRNDDRLEPCYGLMREECVSKGVDSIQWSPGDGGEYTIAVYAPCTPEGSAELFSWIEE